MLDTDATLFKVGGMLLNIERCSQLLA